MDLVAGLHWLHENLGAFGGDPDRLTLFGYGTGAALANFLAVSPMVKGNTTPWKLVCSKVVRRIRSMLHDENTSFRGTATVPRCWKRLLHRIQRILIDVIYKFFYFSQYSNNDSSSWDDDNT